MQAWAKVVIVAHHSTQETYSPVGSRNRLMYWSWLQSTGAEMRKYLTALSVSIARHCLHGATHDCRPAVEQRQSRPANSVGRPRQAGRSRGRRSAAEEVAWSGGVAGRDTLSRVGWVGESRGGSRGDDFEARRRSQTAVWIER